MAKIKKIDDSQLSLKDAIKKMEEKHGEGIVMKLDSDKKVKVDVIPTGSISLDAALGVGGIAQGRIIEVYGPESSGKTTLALHIVSEAQKMGLVCAFIDAEHALDTEYARKLEVDVKELYISQPSSGEQALDVVEEFVKTGKIGLIIVDSVAALTPIAEINGEMGATHMGLQARLMSQALRKLTAITDRSKCTIIFINQIRMNIGQTYGSPETTTGGRALRFYTSMRIEIRRTNRLVKGDDVIGSRVVVKVVKNKLASPFKTTTFDIIFNEGISKINDLLTFAMNKGIVKKEGLTLYFENEKLGAGLDKAKTALIENTELLSKIKTKCKELI